MGVLEFKRPEPQDPHLSGQAQCFGCQHKWVAVAPVGTKEMECPNCHCIKGVFRNICAPEKDKKIWVCECGCDLFMLIEKVGYMCVNCGTYQRF